MSRREATSMVGDCVTDLSLSCPIPSRAILVRRDEVRPLSSEFTPETERQRIQQLVGTLGRGRLWSSISWVEGHWRSSEGA